MAIDRYKKALEHDVRLTRRNIRNHLVSENQVKEYQTQLPDSTSNARWLRQDGTPCSAEEEQVLLDYHANGWNQLLTGDGQADTNQSGE